MNMEWPTIVMIALVVLTILGIIFRRQVVGFVNGLMLALGWFWVLIIWVFPPILMGIAWLFPGTHELVAYPVTDNALRGLIVPSTLGIVWFAAQWATAQSANTGYRALQADLVVSILWAYLFVGIAVSQFTVDKLLYWQLLPAVFTATEALMNAITAINNAFQKNPTQLQRN